METTNWIEKIKKIVHIAISKKLYIEGTYDDYFERYTFKLENNFEFRVYIGSEKHIILLYTPKGKLSIDYSISDRENLELQSLILSIKEYNEDMAISELEEFISGKKEDSELTINDLDNEDD